jgi:hypothetical protein
LDYSSGRVSLAGAFNHEESENHCSGRAGCATRFGFVKLLLGVAPATRAQTSLGTFWGVSAVLDFMFWPRKHVGWYVEPAYEATFGMARRCMDWASRLAC